MIPIQHDAHSRLELGLYIRASFLTPQQQSLAMYHSGELRL